MTDRKPESLDITVAKAMREAYETYLEGSTDKLCPWHDSDKKEHWLICSRAAIKTMKTRQHFL
jgi:ribosome modulation factor